MTAGDSCGFSELNEVDVAISELHELKSILEHGLLDRCNSTEDQCLAAHYGTLTSMCMCKFVSNRLNYIEGRLRQLQLSLKKHSFKSK